MGGGGDKNGEQILLEADFLGSKILESNFWRRKGIFEQNLGINFFLRINMESKNISKQILGRKIRGANSFG